jgi:peptide/nickel transport system permease protein
MRRARRPPALLAGATMLLLLSCAGLSAPWIAPHPPAAQDLTRRIEKPTAAHPLGRDDLGRDVLSRLLYGARTSLPVALAVVALSAVAGTFVGGVAGAAGGAVDAALVALMDLLLAFPGILLAIGLIAVRGPGIGSLVAALTLLGWVAFARLARGEAQRLIRRPFVAAARAAGAGPARVLARHLIPHLAAPAAVQAAFALGGVIVAEAGLSFLGLGIPPPAATWGGMLREGTQHLLDAPRLAIWPGAALAITLLAAQWLGEGLGGEVRG